MTLGVGNYFGLVMEMPPSGWKELYILVNRSDRIEARGVNQFDSARDLCESTLLSVVNDVLFDWSNR